MRTPVIAGNWKLFKTIGEAVSLVNDLTPLVAEAKGVEIVVAPVFTALSRAADAAAGSNIRLAAQDCYWEEEGAFTGEVAPKLLKDAGCSHVIIGHSERRQYFGEVDETVNKKAKAAIAAGLTAIVCVGETLAEREADATFSVIEKQIKGAFAGFSADILAKVVIAYEPVWAIGTGVVASPEQAQDMHKYIRSLIAGRYGETVADNLTILYGGSCKSSNAAELFSKPDVDGGLIGGAALDATEFHKIVQSF